MFSSTRGKLCFALSCLVLMSAFTSGAEAWYYNDSSEQKAYLINDIENFTFSDGTVSLAGGIAGVIPKGTAIQENKYSSALWGLGGDGGFTGYDLTQSDRGCIYDPVSITIIAS